MNHLRVEFGEVVGQLLESTYVPVHGGQLTKSQAMAVQSAQEWAAALVAFELTPDADAPVSIHRGDSATTCDSVRLLYQSESPIPALEIEISQSFSVIVISIRAQLWPVEWKGDDPAEAVTRTARRFFRDSERLYLKLQKRRDGVLVGIQDPDKRLSREARDWRDSLQWWQEPGTLGFVIMKRTGWGQMVLPTFDLQPNLKWFDVLGRPRTG